MTVKRNTACSDWINLPLPLGTTIMTFDGKPTMKLGDTEYRVMIGIDDDNTMITAIRSVEPLPSPPLKKES